MRLDCVGLGQIVHTRGAVCEAKSLAAKFTRGNHTIDGSFCERHGESPSRPLPTSLSVITHSRKLCGVPRPGVRSSREKRRNPITPTTRKSRRFESVSRLHLNHSLVSMALVLRLDDEHAYAHRIPALDPQATEQACDVQADQACRRRIRR